MPIDTSIITGMQQPDFSDAIVKGTTLAGLAQQGRMRGLEARKMQQEADDSQALRNAAANNTTIDKSGTYTQNPQGTLAELAKTAPHLVPQVQQQLASQKASLIDSKINLSDKQRTELAKIIPMIHDQQTLDAAYSYAEGMGLPTDKYPKVWDPVETPKFLQTYAMSSLAPDKQIAAGAEQQKIDLTKTDQALKRDQFQDTKHTEAFKDLMAHAESSRQLPDVKQAYIDRYNTQKIKDLIGNGDPNKISPQMVNLMIGEVSKVATGGTPTEETMKGLTPDDAKLIMARYKTYLTSHPQAGEQGAFVNVFKDYANTLQTGANKVIEANIGKLGELYKDHLRPDDYQKYQDTLVRGNPYSLQQTQAAAEAAKSEQTGGSKSSKAQSSHSSLPVGSVSNGYTKTKNGWVQLDASK